MNNNIDTHPELERKYCNPEKNLRTRNDFERSPFEQFEKSVPDQFKNQFSERFLKRSAYLFPLLIFFNFVRMNPRKIKKEEEDATKKVDPVFEVCTERIIDKVRTFVWYSPFESVCLVFTLGHVLIGGETEKNVCTLSLYDNNIAFSMAMNFQNVSFAGVRPLLSIKGTQSPEHCAECAIYTESGFYYTDEGSKEGDEKFALFTELVRKVSLLKSTSKVFDTKRPIHDDGPGANYDLRSKS